MFVAPRVEKAQIVGEAKEEAQFLDPQIGAGEMRAAPAGVSRLDEGVEHVERGRLDAVSEQELLPAREALHGGHEPEEEAVMRLQRRTRLARARPFAGAIDAHRNRRAAPAARHSKRREAEKIRPGGKPPGPPKR